MRLTLSIPSGDHIYYFRIPVDFNSCRIEVPGVVIIDLFKVHDHRYDIQAFFYNEKVICSSRSFRSKTELYGAIQKLLQEYL